LQCKKQRPPGEEIRRALLMSIGSLGGGDRRPTDDKDITCLNGGQKRAIGMAPMHEPHAFRSPTLNAARATACA